MPGESSASPSLTFDYYQELALGHLGWDPSVFYSSTPRELENALKGFFKLHELQQRQEWERQRWSTVTLVNIQLPKNKKVKPKDLVEFPWERKVKPSQISHEEAKKILSKWQKA